MKTQEPVVFLTCLASTAAAYSRPKLSSVRATSSKIMLKSRARSVRFLRISMDTYIKRTNIPFPIIANAEKIAKDYGVNSYPRFFLVNEKGMIEKIVRGFDKEFLDNFKK